jgi:Kdo2-lipid IVA lauroyltransferase/acyltransferase
MPSPRTKLRDVAEYAAARAVILMTRVIPRRAVPAFCRGLGRVLHSVLGGRRKVVYDNVRLAYGADPGAPDPRTISKASFAALCRSFLELFLIPAASRPQDFVRAISFGRGHTPESLRACAGPGPYVFAASHFGAWEIAGAAGALFGEPLTTLIRPLDNPLLDAYLNGIRMRFGQRLASNRGGLRDLLASLDAGRSVAVLVDLNMRRKGAVFVDFFGTPAATARTPGVLAVRAQRPIVPVFTHRRPGMFAFEIEIGDPIFPDRKAADRDAEVFRLVVETTRAVERRIRAAPDQWLWTHRRWKTRPGELTS